MAADEDKHLVLRVSYDELLERSRKFERSSNSAPKRSQRNKFDGDKTAERYGEAGLGFEHECMKVRSSGEEASLARSGRRKCKATIDDFRSEWTAHSSIVEAMLSQWSGSPEKLEIIERNWSVFLCPCNAVKLLHMQVPSTSPHEMTLFLDVQLCFGRTLSENSLPRLGLGVPGGCGYTAMAVSSLPCLGETEETDQEDASRRG